VKLSVKID